MTALIEEITRKQLRSLRLIFGVLVTLVLLLVASSWWLGSSTAAGTIWVEVILGSLAAILIGVLLPWQRRRMMDIERVRHADEDLLQRWGLPPDVDLHLGRPAVYLTRYTAGCVLSWGLSAAVALYGLVARMLGAGALVSGLFFATATFSLLLLPPDGKKLRQRLTQLLGNNL